MEITETSRHEARHAGFCHQNDITVERVRVQTNGWGNTLFIGLRPEELAALYSWYERAATEKMTAYLAACMVGTGGAEGLMSAKDQALLYGYKAMWDEIAEYPPDGDQLID